MKLNVLLWKAVKMIKLVEMLKELAVVLLACLLMYVPVVFLIGYEYGGW